MREINHRAKNMLSLVQAIACQTAARDPEDFIECFTKRIQALAANQNLLVRNEWQGFDVEDPPAVTDGALMARSGRADILDWRSFSPTPAP